MGQWEYLFLKITTNSGDLRQGRDMLVSTSDGRWQGASMPADPISVLNTLGSEGWEMVQHMTHGGWAVHGGGGPFTFDAFAAVFKRPSL